MLYLMSPYSGSKPDMTRRYLKTVEVCADLFNEGLHVFSPIAHWHLAAELFNLPRDAQHWAKYNLDMFSKSDACILLQIEGWQESKGVEMELAWAEEKGKLVYSLNPDSPESYKRVVQTILEEIQGP